MTADWGNPHGVRVGNVYRINDTRNMVIVTAISCNRADVLDQHGKRPRSILLSALRSSNAKHGYTLLEQAPL